MNIITHFLCFILFLASVIAEDLVENGNNNIDVILFLAKTSRNVNYKRDNGISFLQFPVKGRLKPCTSKSKINLPANYKNVIRSHGDSDTCNCEKNLESSLLSLSGWARNAMGMVTAIVSSYDTKSDVNERSAANNRERDYMGYNIVVKNENDVQKQSKGDTGALTDKKKLEMKYFDRENFVPLPFDPSNVANPNFPELVRDDDDNNIPIFNAFPPKAGLKFNNVDKYKSRGEELVNVHRVKRGIVVEPSHTQVFEIDDNVKPESNEIIDIPALSQVRQPDTIWDLLGVMSAIRNSFFSNFFSNEFDPVKRMSEEESGLNFGALGQIIEPTLFELVRNTLKQVRREKSLSKSDGYILTVMGGSLADIKDPYSDLVQSVKYAMEQTNSNKTMIVLTGTCPEKAEDIEFVGKDELKMKKRGKVAKYEESIPFYAKGPFSYVMMQADELFDVPLKIRDAILANKIENARSARLTGIIPKSMNLKAQLGLFKMKRESSNEIPKQSGNNSLKNVLNKHLLLLYIFIIIISLM